jgi:hypothetical protein
MGGQGMDRQPTTQDKSEAWRRDCLFAGIMLVIFCMFITGLISIPLWLSNQNQKIISANATSTAFAVATQQIIATATVAAQSTQQAQYESISHFNQNLEDWYVGEDNTEYGDVKVSIKNGVYIWEILDPKGHIQGTALYPTGSVIEDFDAYIDSKFVDSSALGVVCSGLIFRKSALSWDDGAYVFSICNDSHYEVQYYQSNTWETIKASSNDVIQRTDWNRIGIRARGDHFIFTINNLDVFEMTDDRRKNGGMRIFIGVEDNNSAVIWFDNFGFQSR